MSRPSPINRSDTQRVGEGSATDMMGYEIRFPIENGCVAKFFEIRDNARFLAIEKPND
jgi:hypothetical protein